MADGRGGYQAPSSPAPVSGIGAASKRTDGGPGARQPVRAIPATAHGDRAASVAQQQAAPVRAGGPQTPSAAPSGPPGAAPPGFNAPDLWGPTERPGEPVTAGVPFGPGGNGPPPDPMEDVADRLRALFLADPDNVHLGLVVEEMG